MTQRLITKVKADKVSNVFIFCHGWKGVEAVILPPRDSTSHLTFRMMLRSRTEGGQFPSPKR